jgi:two-component system phosphate regulon response regulator OmpR
MPFIDIGILMKPHILVVDDEEPIRSLLADFFRKHGYNVSTSATADEARNIIETQSVNLVILDIALSDEDGLEILGWIKSYFSNLPVIMLTGMGFDDELLQEALKKGASGYVSKTLPLNQLLMEVHRILKSA